MQKYGILRTSNLCFVDSILMQAFPVLASKYSEGNIFRVWHILQPFSEDFRQMKWWQNIRNEQNICQYCVMQWAIIANC